MFDNNLSPRIARAFAALMGSDECVFVALREKYSASAKDVDWIKSLGTEGDWVIISADQRITKNASERAAWRKARLKGFFLNRSWSKMTNLEKTAKLLLWWPNFEKQIGLVAPGTIFLVPINVGSKLKTLPI